jgi:hypothetical protein
MSEGMYRIIGWGIFLALVGLAVFWGATHSGLAGFFMDMSKKLADGAELTQISWGLTLAILGFPGWMIKNYFEGLAWNVHVKNLPPPDPRESARRSKYIQVDNLPPVPPKPVTLTNLPEGQEEFIATCPACGNFFSAKKGVKDLKCSSCGESVPTQ